jgi:hypothetical protein
VNEPAPTIYGREVEENEGDRTTSRPSAQARKAKVRRVREHLVADGIDNDGWEEAGLLMPDEEKPEDTGWKAGPVEKDLPEFTGPKPGPSDPALNESSSVTELGTRFVTDELCKSLLSFAKGHCVHYRTQKGLIGPDSPASTAAARAASAASSAFFGHPGCAAALRFLGAI